MNYLFLLIPWLINIGYSAGIFPQLYLNYKKKSTAGLSDLTILGYFNGYVAYFIYAYYFNFPLAYKILLPVAVIVSSILIFQRFFYSDGKPKNSAIYLYYIDFALILLSLPFIYFLPYTSASIAGWLSALIWFLYLIPQVLNIYLRKSVEGFSFLLVLYVGLGGIGDLGVSILGFTHVDKVMCFTGLRGIFFFLIFAYQFWLYKKK